MKRTFLARLQRSALYCLIGALLLVVGVPLYQLIILNLAGYSSALTSLAQTLRWINVHGLLFVGYRVLLIAGFALMLGFPFALFRIIVAQEIIGRAELESENNETDSREDQEPETEEPVEQEQEQNQAAQEQQPANPTAEGEGMPEFAWRGKGFGVMAAWTGISGLFFFAAGTLASTIYLLIVASSLSTPLTGDAAPLTGLFAVLTFTVGGGLLAFSCLFFGAVIARSGRTLWPGPWLFFGYTALAIAALMSGSAVQVAFAPAAGQAALSTPAILLFALWALWFGVVVVRLKPE